VIASLVGVALALWLLAALLLRARGDLAKGPYPSPDAAQEELRRLAAAHPATCTLHEIGRSAEGRPLLALRLRGAGASEAPSRPRLLVTAQIHAVEFVSSLVVRALARTLAEGDGRDPEASALLAAADVWLVPLVNPDGAARIWRRGGWTSLRAARATSRGVDPNRNFPFEDAGEGRSTGRRASWNAASARPGSAYYRGPHPLSEPECAALAALAERLRPSAALNFHSIGAVVYLPADETGAPLRSPAFDVFRGAFQSRQCHRRYAPVLHRPARTRGQLDPFLWRAFGTPSVTVEVSRPDWRVLLPWHAPRLFWWANPPDPRRWLENDVGATIGALVALASQASPDTTERRSVRSEAAS
jgi:hypothetical protein